MKFFSFGQGTLIPQPRNYPASNPVRLFFVALWSATRTSVSKAITRIQIGRMITVLSNMSDEQLALIGITRREIRPHAEFLITYEYDGL